MSKSLLHPIRHIWSRGTSNWISSSIHRGRFSKDCRSLRLKHRQTAWASKMRIDFTLVIGFLDRAETLLPSGIPKLGFYLHKSQVIVFHSEIHTNSGQMLLIETFIILPSNQWCLPYSAVSSKNHLHNHLVIPSMRCWGHPSIYIYIFNDQFWSYSALLNCISISYTLYLTSFCSLPTKC